MESVTTIVGFVILLFVIPVTFIVRAQTQERIVNADARLTEEKKRRFQRAVLFCNINSVLMMVVAANATLLLPIRFSVWLLMALIIAGIVCTAVSFTSTLASTRLSQPFMVCMNIWASLYWLIASQIVMTMFVFTNGKM